MLRCIIYLLTHDVRIIDERHRRDVKNAVPTMNWITLPAPAECDVNGQFVDFSLVSQAVIAGVGKKGQPLIVGEHGVAEAIRTSLQSNKGLRCDI